MHFYYFLSNAYTRKYAHIDPSISLYLSLCLSLSLSLLSMSFCFCMDVITYTGGMVTCIFLAHWLAHWCAMAYKHDVTFLALCLQVYKHLGACRHVMADTLRFVSWCAPAMGCVV